MKFVCDLLIMMFVAGTPFTAFMYETGPLQYFVIISSFLQSIPWLCASVSMPFCCTLQNIHFGCLDMHTYRLPSKQLEHVVHRDCYWS